MAYGCGSRGDGGRAARRLILTGWASLACMAATVAPASAQECVYTLSSQSFAGDAQAQAGCLLRPLRIGGALASPTPLPASLLDRIERPTGISVQGLRAYLGTLADPYNVRLGANLERPVSRTAQGLQARYFVIHDTSAPNLGDAPFPADFDTGAAANRLNRYLGSNAVAHMFVNRLGEIGQGHDFATPWRATSLEMRHAGVASRGRFLHVELVQPRRRDPDPRYPSGNDRLAPTPGFTAQQYDSLALLYIVASVRAGRWLIPAFHANVDRIIPGGHDDPQSFDILLFERALQRHQARLPVT